MDHTNSSRRPDWRKQRRCSKDPTAPAPTPTGRRCEKSWEENLRLFSRYSTQLSKSPGMNEIPDEHEQERSPHRVRRRRIPHDAQALPQHGDGDALIRHVFIPQIEEREKEDGGIDEAQQRDGVLVTDVLEGEVWQKEALTMPQYRSN